MTRSHTLLHCPSEKLRAARAEAWEGRDLGGIRVLLNNPRWERRLLKFLELSGVGKVVEDSTDEEETRAARMDEWIAWEAEERVEIRYLFLIFSFVKGDSHPELCAQRVLRAEDFFCGGRGRGPKPVSFV